MLIVQSINGKAIANVQSGILN